MCSSLGDADGMEKTATMAVAQGKLNIAFTCLFLTGKLERCIDMLCDDGECAVLLHRCMPEC